MSIASGGRVAGLVLVLSVCVGAAASTAAAQDATPPFFAVIGVPAGDVLNMRDVPHADSQKLGAIPPGERGLKNLGCLRPEPSLDRWLTMTEEERKNAKLEWCRVEYHGRQGWVAARFLKPDGAPPQ